jgi:ABC-type phosphate/phosphonate transport system substrate-binding protein
MKTYKGTEEDKTQALIKVWNSFPSPREREWWVKSLPLDQRALIRQALNKLPNKLF